MNVILISLFTLAQASVQWYRTLRFERFFSVRFLLISIFFTTHSLSTAGVAEELNYRYYDVMTDHQQSLGTLLNASTPVREAGQVFHGSTVWSVQWRIHWQQNSQTGLCQVTSANVRLKAEVTLPKLSGGSLQQQQEFDRYIVSLREHELGHVQHGRQAAAAIDRALKGLSSDDGCKSLHRLAENKVKTIVDFYTDISRLYDQQTGHGRSQGAYLVI